jgi:citrate lyase subunit beta/citryl-CoA lyase
MQNSAQVLTARSLLFVPGDSPRKLAKAAGAGADMLLLDLEDAVAEAEKPQARTIVRRYLDDFNGSGERPWVRINALSTLHALHDLAAIVGGKPGGIMLPKARSRADVMALDHYLSALEVAAGVEPGAIRIMIVATETPEALFNIGGYAGAPRLAAMTWGAEDIATALGAIDNRLPDGSYDHPYQLARSLCLAGAAAAGVPAIETIHGNFRDTDGLHATATAARRAGFTGMMAIHPDQVAIINQAFTPGEEEVARAKRIVALFAANPELGTIGMDGEMLDVPHLKRAQAVLARARDL